MLLAKCAAAAAALALPIFGVAHAEPASADPTFVSPDGRTPSPTRLAQFRLAGANCSIAARGRRASIDTNRRLNDLARARAMSKFLPGYPQPALMTIDLRLSF